MAAVCHVALVAAGALCLSIDGSDLLSRAVRLYAGLSAADNGYGFFAAPILPRPVAMYRVTDRSGIVTSTELESGSNREAAGRLGSVALAVAREMSDSRRRSLLASAAGKVFARYPGAIRVEVTVSACAILPLRQALLHARPPCTVFHRATFVRNGQVHAGISTASGEAP